MSLNACELEIDLFCRGMRVPDSVSLEGARGVSRTRAGLGSGLEIVIPTGSRTKREIWMNVPVVERFAHASPYRLAGGPGAGYHVLDERQSDAYPVRLPPEPAWYSRETSRGITMNRIGVMQGTCLGIYINSVCAFWSSAALKCGFCTTGQNVGAHESLDKSISDVIETCWAAREETGATFVHLNGGFQGSRGIEFVLPYVEAIKSQVGMLVGVQLAPERDFTRYDALVGAGVDHLSFCLELLDPVWFARICPGKSRVHGQQLFFRAMKYCADLMPAGAVSGEIIAGIEPPDRTLAAIDRIASLGAFPTVCIFRPTVGSGMEEWPSPPYDEMRKVMVHMYEACRDHRFPIGAAPNIEVSLVVTPDEASMLVPHDAAFYWYELYRKFVKTAARPIFKRRMRAQGEPSAGPRAMAAT